MMGGPGLPSLDCGPGDLPNELVSATLTAAKTPDNPTAQAATAIADAMTRHAAFRKWLKYTIAILIAIALSATGLHARSVLSEPPVSTEQQNDGGHCPLAAP